MQLDELAVKHNTDKRMAHHGYTGLYHRLFDPIRNKQLKVLEIGVKDGASIRMWHDYFPKSKIIGVDVNPKCKRHEAKRIDIAIGDQGDEVFLDNLIQQYKNFDIIIDDGSHRWSHQVGSFEKLFPALRPGGYYAIEDLHTSYAGNSVFKDSETRPSEYFIKLALAVMRDKKRQFGIAAVHIIPSLVVIQKA